MQQPTALLVADARAPDVLVAAGIRMHHCLGLIALTGDDQVNQTIVIGARALAPQLPAAGAGEVRRPRRRR